MDRAARVAARSSLRARDRGGGARADPVRGAAGAADAGLHRGCPRKAHRRDDRRAQERLRDRDRTRSGIGRPRAFRPRRRRVGRRANRLAERKMIDPARLAALLAACLVTVAASVPASADYLDIAQFALTEHDGGRFRLVATLSDAADTGLSPTWPRACTLRSREASRLPNARRVAFRGHWPPA